MKKIIIFIVLTLAVFSAFANNGNFLANDDARQALYGAVDKAAVALKTAPFGQNPIAILPLKAGHSVLAGRLKNMLVQNGFVCVEGKEDPMWDEILKEIEWHERKSDILDSKTIVKFGKLKAAKILFQCEIRIVDKNADRLYAEIELRATDIATKQVIWGGTFANRYYIGKNVQGIISLDDELRQTLKKSFIEAKKSLTTPQVAGKLNNIKTITIVPLNGDIDSYMTQLATAMITQTHLMPLNPHIPSLMQIRSTARDGLLKCDAILYGAIRALHKTKPETTRSGKKMVTKHNIVAEIQLFIEDAKNGNILWGETITVKEPIVSERDLNAAELKQLRQEKIDTIPDDIKEDVADNWKSYLKIIGIIIGGIAVLLFIVIAIKAFFSFNNVR